MFEIPNVDLWGLMFEQAAADCPDSRGKRIRYVFFGPSVD